MFGGLTRQLLRNNTLLINNAHAGYASCAALKVAVILSGCGVQDGSEIHEAVSVLSHITRNDCEAIAFAPNKQQFHVINHATGQVDETHKRFVMPESARITRGKILDLCQLIENMHCFDALIFPGGFGVAKNLSDYASKGHNFNVMPEVAKIIEEFHKAKKPMGFACISPLLAARVLCNVLITLGKNDCNKWPHRAAIEDAKKLGATIEYRNWNEISFDKQNLIFSTPAYMYDGKYHEIDDGIGKMVKYMLLMIRKGDIKTATCVEPTCKAGVK